MTLALTDEQLRFVTACCFPLPVEKRSLFLERLVAQLKITNCLRGASDTDIDAACCAAVVGLVQGAA
jgi:hypothetical protein